MAQIPRSQHTFLDDLDARQEEVLGQLDELNHKIKLLLRQCGEPLSDPPVTTQPAAPPPALPPAPTDTDSPFLPIASTGASTVISTVVSTVALS